MKFLKGVIDYNYNEYKLVPRSATDVIEKAFSVTAVAPIILVWFGLGMQSKLAIALPRRLFPGRGGHGDGAESDAARPHRAWPFATGIALADVLEGAVSGGAAFRLFRRQGRGHARGDRRGDRRIRRLGKRPGNLLLSANSQLDGPLAWAALVWLSVLGIVLFLAARIGRTAADAVVGRQASLRQSNIKCSRRRPQAAGVAALRCGNQGEDENRWV